MPGAMSAPCAVSAAVVRRVGRRGRGGWAGSGVMSESRQQRRARERAEAKGSRPGPRLTPSPVLVSGAPRTPQVLEVDLGRYVALDDPTYVSWVATWGLREDSVGTEDSSEDLAELVSGIVEDAGEQRRGRGRRGRGGASYDGDRIPFVGVTDPSRQRVSAGAPRDVSAIKIDLLALPAPGTSPVCAP